MVASLHSKLPLPSPGLGQVSHFGMHSGLVGSNLHRQSFTLVFLLFEVANFNFEHIKPNHDCYDSVVAGPTSTIGKRWR